MIGSDGINLADPQLAIKLTYATLSLFQSEIERCVPEGGQGDTDQ